MPRMPSNGTFDTAPFFSGGAGAFICYYDVIKPVWFYVIIKMIVSGESYGLPIDIIQNMSITSLIEWYCNRRYTNPLQQLDWAHGIPPDELDQLLKDMLDTDPTLFKLCPMLNMNRIFYVYRQQHMTFPIYIYSETYSPFIKDDCKECMSGIDFQYVYGDLRQAIQRCDQNFTYIFNDIELVKEACDILMGTYSHILMTSDYRYNYKDFKITTKYDMKDMMLSHPFIRLGTTSVWNSVSVDAFAEVLKV